MTARDRLYEALDDRVRDENKTVLIEDFEREVLAEVEAAQAAEPRATDGAVQQARLAIHDANDGPVPADGGESR